MMKWERLAEDGRSVVNEVCTTLRPLLERVSTEIAERLRRGGKVMTCGNGGSASDAQHMTGELVNRFLLERRPYAGIALCADMSVLTSISNDYSFEEIFSKQVQALGRKGDVLVGFSTSGKSGNLCRAFEAANSMEDIWTVAIAGSADSPLVHLAKSSLCIQSVFDVPRIQEGHHLLMHVLCQLVEEKMERVGG